MNARLPKGPSMNELVKQAQKMQEDAQIKQAELEAKEYEATAGGGMVKVKINGKKEVLSIDINPAIVDPDDIETLQDIVVAAVNEAIKTATADYDREMGKITGGLGGLGGGLGGLF